MTLFFNVLTLLRLILSHSPTRSISLFFSFISASSIRSNLLNSQLTNSGNDLHCFPSHCCFQKSHLWNLLFPTLIHWVAKGNDLPLDARDKTDRKWCVWYNHQQTIMEIRADNCVHYLYGFHILCIPTENIWTSCQSVPSLLVCDVAHFLPSFLFPKNIRPAFISLKTLLKTDMWSLSSGVVLSSVCPDNALKSDFCSRCVGKKACSCAFYITISNALSDDDYKDFELQNLNHCKIHPGLLV